MPGNEMPLRAALWAIPVKRTPPLSSPERIHAQEQALERGADHQHELAVGHHLPVEVDLGLVGCEHAIFAVEHGSHGEPRGDQPRAKHAVVAPVREQLMVQRDGPADHAGAEEHPVLDVAARLGLDPQQRPLHQPLGQGSLLHRRQQLRHAPHRIAAGPEIEGRHVGAAAAYRRDQRQSLEGLPLQDLRQRVLERAVAAVDDEQVDAIPRQLGDGFRHGAGAPRLDVKDVAVVAQQIQDPRDLVLAAAGAEIVQKGDLHGFDSCETQGRGAPRSLGASLLPGKAPPTVGGWRGKHNSNRQPEGSQYATMLLTS
jgi:hypothetical protein